MAVFVMKFNILHFNKQSAKMKIKSNKIPPLTIHVTVTKKYKLEIITDTDGYKDYAEVEVKIKPSRIDNISPNPSSNNIQIDYKINEANSSYLMIIGQNISNNYVLDISANQTTIDVSDYEAGYYSVALVCDGQIVDAKTFLKQ